MSSWLGKRLRQRSRGHSLLSSGVIFWEALRLTAAQTMNLCRAHSSREVSRELRRATAGQHSRQTNRVKISEGRCFSYTQDGWLSVSDEADVDVTDTALLVDVLNRRRLRRWVGLRVKRRRADTEPASSKDDRLLFSMTVASPL